MYLNIDMLKTRPVVIHKELLEHYNELGINERELVILIKLIHASEMTNKQPSIESLQKGTSLDSREITAIIQNLIQRDLLELNVNKVTAAAIASRSWRPSAVSATSMRSAPTRPVVCGYISNDGHGSMASVFWSEVITVSATSSSLAPVVTTSSSRSTSRSIGSLFRSGCSVS